MQGIPRRRRAAGTVWLLASTVGCGGESSIVIEPFIAPADEPSSRALGVDLSETFTIGVKHCPWSIDHPDCSVEDVEDADVDAEGEAAALDDQGGGRFELTGVHPGTEILRIEADGLGPERFAIDVVEVGSSSIFVPLRQLADDASLTRARVLVGSEGIVVEQVHYSVEGDRPLLGRAPWVIEGDGAEATIEVSTVSLLRVGERPGRIELSTTIGGALSIDVVEPSAIDTFYCTLDAAADDEPITELPLDPPDHPWIVYLRPFAADGTAILGNGGPAPEVASSTDAVDIVAKPEGLGDSKWRSFGIQPVHRGTSEITVRWMDAEYRFAVLVP